MLNSVILSEFYLEKSRSGEEDEIGRRLRSNERLLNRLGTYGHSAGTAWVVALCEHFMKLNCSG
jgi:hypothetical protein